MNPDGKIGNRSYLIRLCFVASLGGLLFGFDTAVISGTFAMVEAQFSLSKIQVGWFGSAALVGCILGALVCGSLSDRYGRKPMLVVASLLLLISALGSTIPPTFTVLIYARLIGGIGVGMASVLAPLYISELSPPHLRGRLVAFYQFSIVIGILLSYFSNWLLLSVAQAHSTALQGWETMRLIFIAEVWRAMFGAEMIPGFLFLLLLFGIPESPRWLITRGREEAGRCILSRISGPEMADVALQEIKRAMAAEQGTMAELLKPGLRTALAVGIGLSFFGQLTGVNIVIYYGPIVLEQAGFKLSGALSYQVLIGFINLIFTILALWKIDRWGRRPLLIAGMALVTASLLIIALQFSLQVRSALWIGLALCSYMACVALSICAVIWVITGEIFPNRIRGRAMSLATFVNWGTNFISVFLFPWYVAQFGVHTGFFTFAAICLLATIFFWKWVPETKGKTLEQIEGYWYSLAVHAARER